MKPRKILPFPVLYCSKASRPQHLPQSESFPHPSTLLLLFSLLLTAYPLLFLFSCKDIGIPPDKIIPDTTNHGPDTTSHNFIWSIDTLGDGGSSVLNDVAIINDTLIYAVGEIYLKDSSGQIDPLPYNAAVWRGISWEVKRISVTYNGNLITPPLEGVFAFSPTDIWVVGSFPIHGNGSQWTLYHLQDMGLSVSVSRAWGTSSSNMYFVGRQGSIAHFDGSTWTKVESGTSVDIQDVWGDVGEDSGIQTVIALASFLNAGRGLDLLQIIDGGAATKLETAGLHVSQNSLWFDEKGFYIAGNGVYWKKRLSDTTWTLDDSQPSLYKDRIRGNGQNDVMIAGSGGLVSHFNGSTWGHFAGNELPLWFARYTGLSMKGNLVAIAGWKDDRAVAILGRRN